SSAFATARDREARGPAMEQVRTLSTVAVADSTGVRPATTTTDLRDLVANIDFCWVDVSVRDEAVRKDVLAQLGLEAPDLSWALRFGQSPRMVIDRRGLRAVTWLADATGDVAEVHVLCSPRGVVTVWSGDGVAHYVGAIAQRQGDQINRLTLVSLIFLPLTFITGFFGMNFGWMNEVIGSASAFVALGVALPAVSVVVTMAWLRRRGLI